MRSLSFAIAMAVAVASAPVLAQAPAGPPSHVRGTVEKLDGATLTVKSREGADVALTLPADIDISATVKRNLSDIKPGDYIASTSVKGSDGKLHALEIHIFTEAQRKFVPQGQTPYDLAPHSLMTNSIVEGIAGAPQGQVFTVTYKGEKTEIVVAPDTPVVTTAPGDRSLLKPGAAVVVTARKDAAGKMMALRITAEKDGVKPPM